MVDRNYLADADSRGDTQYSLLIVPTLGTLVGIIVAFLADLELRWIVFGTTAVVGLLIMLLFRDKDRLLAGLFFFALQLDVYLRLMHGRAGSLEGLAFPLVTLVGAGLLVWRYVSSGPASLRAFRFDGLARWPIIAVLAMDFLALVMTSERFIGASKVLSEFQLFFMYWLAFNLTRDEEDLRRVIRIMLITLAIQSVVLYIENALGVNFSLTGDVQQRGEVPRPGGTVSANPAGFSSFITPPLFLALAFGLTQGRGWRPRFALVAALLGVGAIGLTFTRASWAGTAMGLVLLVLMAARRRRAAWGRIMMAVSGLVLFLLALLPTMVTRLSLDYGTRVGANQSSWDERWGLMRIAFNVISHHPLFGLGPGAYGELFKEYILPGMHQWIYTVHNEILLRTAECGIGGGVAFVAMLVAGFRIGSKLSRSSRPAFMVAGMAWVAAMLSLTWQMNWVPWTGFSYNAMLWCMLGVMDAALRIDLGDRAKAAAAARAAKVPPVQVASLRRRLVRREQADARVRPGA